MFAAGFVLSTVACNSLVEVLPPPLVPREPTVEEWPDVGAVITDDVAQLHYGFARGPDGSSLIATLVHRRQIKILKETGLKEATVVLPVDGFSSVTRVVARSVSPSGRVTKMDPYAPKTRRILRPRFEAPEVRETVFTIPGAEVGGVVDYWYVRIYAASELVPLWVFSNSLPTLRAEFSFSSDSGIRVEHRFGRGSKVEEHQVLRREAAGTIRRVFVEHDLPAIYNEPYMPHRSRVSSWVATHVTAAQIPGRTKSLRMERWGDVAKRLRGLIRQVGEVRLSGSLKSRFHYVRDNIHAVEMPSLGVRGPSTAEALFNGDPACSRDAAALLFNGLKGLKIEAYPALLSTPLGPPLIDDFPALYPFVRAVVAVRATAADSERQNCTEDPTTRGLLCSVPEDSWIFLDPLCSNCRFGELQTELTGGRAMLLTPGKPRFIDVPSDPVERNRIDTTFRYELSIRGELVGTMKGEMTGAPARRLRYAAGRNKTGEKRNALLTRTLNGLDSKFTFSNAIFGARRQVDVPLRIGADVRHSAERLDIERFRLRATELVGPAWPRRWRSYRKSPAILPAPRWVESRAEILLPVGYRVEPRDIVKIVTPFAEYAAGYKRRNRMLAFSRRFIIKKQIIQPEDWPDFLEFVHRVEDIEDAGLLVELQEEP